MNEKQKQIILAMLDIEHIFDEYQQEIDLMLEKKMMIEERLKLMELNEDYFEMLFTIFQDIYEALDN